MCFPVLVRAQLAEWAPRRFALSIGVAPSMTFSSWSGLAKLADNNGVEGEASRLPARRHGAGARARSLEGTGG